MKQVIIILRPNCYFKTKEALSDNRFFAMSTKEVLGRGKSTVHFTASEDENLSIAGRIHDIGKPYSREWNEDKQKYTYYNHHTISAYLYLIYWQFKHNNHYYLLNPLDDKAMEISMLIYHHMDKFIGNLEKTKELLGEDLYKKLEIL